MPFGLVWFGYYCNSWLKSRSRDFSLATSFTLVHTGQASSYVYSSGLPPLPLGCVTSIIDLEEIEEMAEGIEFKLGMPTG